MFFSGVLAQHLDESFQGFVDERAAAHFEGDIVRLRPMSVVSTVAKKGAIK